MRFLCASHQRVYAEQTNEHLLEQWVSWMHSAGVCYQCEDWPKAVSFAGSAFDLARVRLDRYPLDRADSLAQLTLSAIYLANIFQHMGRLCESRNALLMASICLQDFEATEHAVCAGELLHCLEEMELRDQLIARYLNLPYRPFQVSGWARLH